MNESERSFFNIYQYLNFGIKSLLFAISISLIKLDDPISDSLLIAYLIYYIALIIISVYSISQFYKLGVKKYCLTIIISSILFYLPLIIIIITRTIYDIVNNF